MANRTREQELVEAIKEWTGSRYLGDDCAVLPNGLLVSSDSLVEKTHFLLEWTTLGDLGWKSCSVNLSDIAAMAGRARFLTVSLAVPPYIGKEHLRQFYQSFVECARTYKAQVVGGDLTRASIFVVGVTVVGGVHENGCLKRSGAKAGDVVVVTGDFGASAAGLWLLQHGSGAQKKNYGDCLERHMRPKPRLCESWALVRQTGERGSLMDASDGLADALVQISRASVCGMTIDSESIPISRSTAAVAEKAAVDALEWALYGGEDYELVGTLPEAIWNSWTGSDNPFTMIGRVTPGADVTLNSPTQAARVIDLSKCFQQIDFS